MARCRAIDRFNLNDLRHDRVYWKIKLTLRCTLDSSSHPIRRCEYRVLRQMWNFSFLNIEFFAYFLFPSTLCRHKFKNGKLTKRHFHCYSFYYILHTLCLAYRVTLIFQRFLDTTMHGWTDETPSTLRSVTSLDGVSSFCFVTGSFFHSQSTYSHPSFRT